MLPLAAAVSFMLRNKDILSKIHLLAIMFILMKHNFINENSNNRKV